MTKQEITKTAREYRELQMMIKELEAEAETLKAEMIAHMEEQGASILQADILTIKWTDYTINRIDTTTLKKELPDIAARYTKTTESKRFQVA